MEITWRVDLETYRDIMLRYEVKLLMVKLLLVNRRSIELLVPVNHEKA